MQTTEIADDNGARRFLVSRSASANRYPAEDDLFENRTQDYCQHGIIPAGLDTNRLPQESGNRRRRRRQQRGRKARIRLSPSALSAPRRRIPDQGFSTAPWTKRLRQGKHSCQACLQVPGAVGSNRELQRLAGATAKKALLSSMCFQVSDRGPQGLIGSAVVSIPDFLSHSGFCCKVRSL